VDGPVDRVEMHERQLAQRLPRLLEMNVYSRAGQRLDEITPPIPLHAFGIETVNMLFTHA